MRIFLRKNVQFRQSPFICFFSRFVFKFEKMILEKNLVGIVACGGKSLRMGRDKSKLVYFAKQQRYHIYEVLCGICSEVFISCNSIQINEIDAGCRAIEDLTKYENSGPMAALLTAFEKFPQKNFLLIGCDYPFITQNDLSEFINSISDETRASAFFNVNDGFYEPLLAYYPSNCFENILFNFSKKNFSLQYFLKSVNAQRFFPSNPKSIVGIDTADEFKSIMNLFNSNAAGV